MTKKRIQMVSPGTTLSTLWIFENWWNESHHCANLYPAIHPSLSLCCNQTPLYTENFSRAWLIFSLFIMFLQYLARWDYNYTSESDILTWSAFHICMGMCSALCQQNKLIMLGGGESLMQTFNSLYGKLMFFWLKWIKNNAVYVCNFTY